MCVGVRCRLVQILNNLLANAAKFTSKGHIRVSAERRGAMWAVRVADTGIGIPEARFDAIFNAFEQARCQVLALVLLLRRAQSSGGDALVNHAFICAMCSYSHLA